MFKIFDFGDTERIAGKLELSGQMVRHMRPVMDEILADMLRIEGILFRSNGRRGGGGWKKLKAETIRKKGDTQILRTEYAKPGYSSIGNNALYRSLTELNAPYQISTVTNYTVTFGTDRPYAGVHEHGSVRKGIPKRPLIRIIPSDIARWNEWITKRAMVPFER